MAVAEAPKKAKPKRVWYTLGDQVIGWIEANCVYPSGPKMGQPVRLMEWQKDFLLRLYTTDEDGRRRIRKALLGVGKGNSKTPLLAWVALYELLEGNEPDPWIVFAAASDKQADIGFTDCKQTCRLSASLSGRVDTFRWEIHAVGRPGKIERVACSGGKLDGKRITLLCADELHEWEEDHWTVLTNGVYKTDTGFIFSATTAGYDKETVCGREYDLGRKIESGEVADPGNVLFVWYEPLPTADYRSLQAWKAANPGYGVIVSGQQLKDALENLPRSQFERYRCNRWVESADFWLPQRAWEGCAGNPALAPGTRTFLCWDGSTKYDSTAVGIAQWTGEGKERRLHLQVRFWERPIDPRTAKLVDEWLMPLAEVESHVRSLFERYDIVKGRFDPAFVTSSAQVLANEGLALEEWPQTNARMVPACQTAYELITQGLVVHDGDPVLAKHIRSAEQVMTREGGWRLRKRHGGAHIDGAIVVVGLCRMAVEDIEEEPKRAPMLWMPGDEGDDGDELAE